MTQTMSRTETRDLPFHRAELSVKALQRDFRDNLFYVLARFPAVATRNDNYLALAYTVRDRLLHRWVQTARSYYERASRTVAYLSAEFLMGPQLGNNLVNLGIYEEAREAVQGLCLDFEELLDQEEEPGLGNGGLGRLAACYLDSLASLEIPAIGYGIRYEFGIFDQDIRDGWQVEKTDKWLRLGNPWEIERPEITFDIPLGGQTEAGLDPQGRYRVRWVPHRIVRGVAHDTPILGYRVGTANMLRLWKAEAPESFDFAAFNVGDFYGAVDEKVVSENLTKVLYPNDEGASGKRLRLEQQFFFASCSLQDMIRIHLQTARDLTNFHEKYAIQLNDTHPSIAIPELMRLLVDVHALEWDTAWDVVRRTFAYTNHTLLPEALERWPVGLFGSVLPRHLEIVYELNRRFLDELRDKFPGDEARIRRMSLIDETGERHVRMAHLACIGSHTINGVARLHSELLKRDVLSDFHEWRPASFCNVTNGVTPRRFLILSNPRLTRLLQDTIGDRWTRDLEQLRALEEHAGDASFQAAWRRVKLDNKADLARVIENRVGVTVDPASMFDIQVKRIHEYKRQHLTALHVVDLYRRLKDDPGLDACPRTVIFGGKAAPGYAMAKLIIKLINSIAEVVNADPALRDRLRVIFLPDFNVKNALHVYPGADLSEQVSTAGKEASGTGNMKFSMNGALTIGTLDGANVEIREAVGVENFFMFGRTAEEVVAIWSRGYDPRRVRQSQPALDATLSLLESGLFSRGDRNLFRPILDSLLHHDPYLVLEDFADYIACQDRVSAAYLRPDHWTRMSILNTGRVGMFSSDRSIRDYCRDIWKVGPVPVELDDPVTVICQPPAANR